MNTKYVIGVDEVGYGAGAGNLLVTAVRAPLDWNFEGLGDSKALTPEKRYQLNLNLLELINRRMGVSHYMCEVSAAAIDQYGLGRMHKRAIANAIEMAFTGDEKAIVDGNINPTTFYAVGAPRNCQIISMVKADQKIPQVMAASILAKEYRDKQMREYYHPLFPMYGWDHNMGYLSKEHREAIKKYGMSAVHRRSYKIKL